MEYIFQRNKNTNPLQWVWDEETQFGAILPSSAITVLSNEETLNFGSFLPTEKGRESEDIVEQYGKSNLEILTYKILSTVKQFTSIMEIGHSSSSINFFINESVPKSITLSALINADITSSVVENYITKTEFKVRSSEKEVNLQSPLETEVTAISPNHFYNSNIYKLQSVKAIVCEVVNNVTYLKTILSKRDVETREKIYEVEMRMFDRFKDVHFEFSTDYFRTPQELSMLLVNKTILFYEA